jgi:hypothetical protein
VNRLIFLTIAATVFCTGAEPMPLFDGKTLNGWEVCNGQATYRVEDGAIVGRTAEGSPNSFLCTAKEYGDFILEFETRTDPVLNSGVQIRSHRYIGDAGARVFDGTRFVDRKFPKGRVYGYQVEVANEQSGASGGIYDEARRGWLHNISSIPAARAAFKDNQWNRYKVEAIGDHIRVWVNGIPAADLVDSTDQTGFIALQVHSFQGPKPAEVRWRNIRIEDLGKHVWKPIWDGKSFNGWTKSGGGEWTIEDGAIHGRSKPGDERTAFLISDDAWKDITARVKFRIPQGNSGFFLRADRQTLAGYEVEIDSQKRTGGFWEVRGRNWVTGPEDNAGVNTSDWNLLTASLHGDRIVFHLNGQKTVDLPNDAQGRKEGHIAVQAHGSRNPTDVWFRDIEILVPAR